MARTRGFTLIEIVVVITIIAVAAAVALPALNAGARQREVRTTLQRFVSAVRRASSVAVFQRRPVELRIHPEDRRYDVIASADRERGESAEGGDGRGRAPRGLLGRSAESEEEKGRATFEARLPSIASFGEIDGGRDLRDDGIVFDFYPNGSSSGGRVELVFDTGGGRPDSYVVVVNPLISSVSLEDE